MQYKKHNVSTNQERPCELMDSFRMLNQQFSDRWVAHIVVIQLLQGYKKTYLKRTM